MNDVIKDKLASLPTAPGVYFHKDSKGDIIYIGKAANLRSRVRQYFQKSRFRDPKTDVLVAEIADIEWRQLDTEADALFVEAELVRRYQPRFNILLRDDKSLQFVRIDYKSDYPTVSLIRRPMDDGAEYFGPYINGLAIKRALRFLRRAFPYATGRPVGAKRVSLHYHLGLDPGLEEGRTSLEQYRSNLRKLMQYLRGERVSLTRGIEREMKQAARARDFERAAALRNQLFALQELGRQILFSDKELMDADRDHALVGLAQLLGLYEAIPQLVQTDGVQGDKGVPFGQPGKASLSKSQLTTSGETRSEDVQDSTSNEQSQPATQQSAVSPAGVSGSAGKQGRTVHRLRRIEGFDISHMQGTDTVASMVVFAGGLPDKSAYRKFKMRLAGNDDFAHMAETISRRLREENRKKWGIGDLMLIDGGKGQLSAATAARDKCNFANLPMIGLAKHQEEIIISKSASILGLDAEKLKLRAAKLGAYVVDSGDFISITLPDNSPITKLLQRIRDESHRFAISYHTVLKRSRVARSLLDDIPGIGPVARKKLLKHFGSMRGVINAHPSELQQVLGVQRGSLLAKYIAANKS
jgi:excinuclease ABC subunit C